MLLARAWRHRRRWPIAPRRSRRTSSPRSSSTRCRSPTSRCWSRWRSCWRATSSSRSWRAAAALPFARFRAKLVPSLLGMTVIPAVLVLIVGSSVVLTARRSLVQRADGRRSSRPPTASPATTTRSVSALVADQAARHGAGVEPASISASADVARSCRAIVTPEVDRARIGMVQVYRAVRGTESAGRRGVGGRRGVAVDAARLGARLGRSAGERGAAGATRAARVLESRSAAAASCMRVRRRDAQRRRARSPASSWPATICSGDLAERARGA